MSAYKSIELEGFKEKLSSDLKPIVIDVRSEKEHSKDHLPGSVNIPFNDRQGFEELDKDKTYFLYCRVGGKSAMAAHQMKNSGFENAYCIKSTFNELKSSFE